MERRERYNAVSRALPWATLERSVVVMDDVALVNEKVTSGTRGWVKRLVRLDMIRQELLRDLEEEWVRAGSESDRFLRRESGESERCLQTRW